MTSTSSEVMQNSLIMMVDDEPIMIDLIQIFLEEYGYKRFIGVSDSRIAIEEINRQKPDALLLDLKMPNKDGFEILEQLRHDPETRHLPVIVLTSANSNHTMMRALELGATDFLAKPVDQSELALRLRNTLTFKAYQDRLKFFDELTGLPNRRKFLQQVDTVISAVPELDAQFAVIVIQLSKLREIAETYGTSFRDAAVKKVAEALMECIRTSEFIARGGYIDSTNVTAHIKHDEFSVLVNRVGVSKDASRVCKQISDALAGPMVIEGKETYVDAGVGIATFPEDGQEADALISKAEIAASNALANRHMGYLFYSDQANEQLRRSVMLQQELRKAVSGEQLYLLFQPQVDAATLQVTGAEALLRWLHPELGMVSPGEFIPVAEEAGLMRDIGELVIRVACRQLVAWEQMGLTGLSMSINVSGQQFTEARFAEKVANILDQTGADPKSIIIEITESLSMTNMGLTLDVVKELNKLDLKVSVDDFGTGYSSLSYLKDFPIQELKIDKAFIDNLPGNKGDRAIIAAIVTMAKTMGYQLVAEGVEQRQQYECLKQLGCDLIQGFYFSRPLAAEDFYDFAAQNRPRCIYTAEPLSEAL